MVVVVTSNTPATGEEYIPVSFPAVPNYDF